MSKEKNERLVPNLRFKGFTDDWMQEKGKEIFNKRSENTSDSDNFALDIGLENLASNSGILTGDTSVRTNSNSVFHKNDTLFGRLRPYLNKWWYATSDGLKSGEIWAIYPKESIDSLFVYYLIQTDRFLYYANISSGTRMPRASWEIITDKVFSIPAPDEQKVIAKLLYKLEKIITLEQEKVDLLSTLRKFLLDNILTARNSFPLLRFQSFSTPWTYSSLSQMATIVGGGTPSTKINKYWDGNINWFTPSEIGETNYVDDSKRKITELGLNKSSAKLLPKNITILFTSRAGIGDAAILSKDASTNQGFQSLVVKNPQSVYFLYSMREYIKREALQKATGSTFLEISRKEMENIKLCVPHTDEQQKIGDLFKEIDELITYKELRIKKIRDLKLSLLNSMLI